MTLNCAIYTRKSTEEGLDQDFNSLDAQREACEAYILSQKNEGWAPIPIHYDDGGFSGGNVERPAFQRLMEHIESGLVQVLVIYKIDRLTRSLADFARVMETLEKHQVTLVSVTQSFNTTTSMGRLTLNMLLSFAQFEREMTAERTRDKIGAMRRKGKHFGGHQVLGYDVVRDPGGSRLVVNPDEAERVQAIFELYRKHQAMIPVVEELARRGWRNKLWTTKAGQPRGGGLIGKGVLWRILTNVVYLGKVAYRGKHYEGEHEAIVPEDLWRDVQTILARNHRTPGSSPGINPGISPGNTSGTGKRHHALLRRVLVCKACGTAMIPTYTAKRAASGATKRYRYYVCGRATKHGRKTCPCPSLPAHEIESFVVEELAVIGQDPELCRHVIQQVEERLGEDGPPLDHAAVTKALSEFGTLWKALSPGEQTSLIQLLVERVAYDHNAGSVSITFRPTGIVSLSEDNTAAPSNEPQETPV